MKLQIIPLVFAAALLWSCQKEVSNQVSYAKETIQEAIPFAPGVISTTNDSEFHLAFTPDGKKAYFSRRAPEEKQRIYETTFENGQWTSPKLSSFSTDRDEAPSITPDGKYFFFGSERPIPNRANQGNFDMNIWMMERSGESWTDPKPLPSPINEVQVEGEQWPSSNNNFLFPVDDKTYYFTTMYRGENAIKLYETTMSNGQFSEPKEIKGLFDNEKQWVYAAVVSPDGQYLVFNSYGAPEGAGGEDIYVAKRTANGWTKAKSIGPKVNTKNEESSPMFSRDGKYFFFSSAENLGNYEYGPWSIYFIETAFLGLDQLFD